MPQGVYRDDDWVLVAYEDGHPMHREDYASIGYWLFFEHLKRKDQFESQASLPPTRTSR